MTLELATNCEKNSELRVIPGQQVCIHFTQFIDDLIASAKQDENKSALQEVQLAEV